MALDSGKRGNKERSLKGVLSMKFLFVDEVAPSQKDPNFLGVGAILIASSSYAKIKENFYKAFFELKWDPQIEFKGRYMFTKKEIFPFQWISASNLFIE